MRLFAYIGPGAGFVMSASFLALFTSILIAMLSLVAWPLRTAWRAIREWRRARPGSCRGAAAVFQAPA